MRLLCFGDSNTYGYDPRSYLGSRYPTHARWPDRLAAETGWDIVNAGMNGRTIPVSLPYLPQADVLLVMLGSNDLLGGCSAREVSDRMEILLTRLSLCYPHTLLIAPPPMKYGDWVTEERLLTQSAQLSGHYQALAEKLGIHFADSAAWNVDLTFDGVHFSEAGHRAFADGLLALLKELLHRETKFLHSI